MKEIVKFLGVLCWVAGFVFLFVNPTIGLVLILAGAVISGWSLLDGAKRREERRAAANAATAPVADRLAELDQLRDAGAITTDEHAAKRSAILDDL